MGWRPLLRQVLDPPLHTEMREKSVSILRYAILFTKTRAMPVTQKRLFAQSSRRILC